MDPPYRNKLELLDPSIVLDGILLRGKHCQTLHTGCGNKLPLVAVLRPDSPFPPVDPVSGQLESCMGCYLYSLPRTNVLLSFMDLCHQLNAMPCATREIWVLPDEVIPADREELHGR